MRNMKLAFALMFLTACSVGSIAQSIDSIAKPQESATSIAALDTEREKQAFRVFLKDIQH